MPHSYRVLRRAVKSFNMYELLNQLFIISYKLLVDLKQVISKSFVIFIILFIKQEWRNGLTIYKKNE